MKNKYIYISNYAKLITTLENQRIWIIFIKYIYILIEVNTFLSPEGYKNRDKIRQEINWKIWQETIRTPGDAVFSGAYHKI